MIQLPFSVIFMKPRPKYSAVNESLHLLMCVLVALNVAIFAFYTVLILNESSGIIEGP